MKKNIAIFPAGTEIGLEIHRALSYSTHLNVFGFSSVNDHSKFIYKNFVGSLPFFSHENFIQVLNDKIKENEIDFIYPAHDDVQLFLSENQSKINAEIITTEIKTVRICRSKIATYEFFINEAFVPKVFNKNSSNLQYPVFIKPDIGQGAKGAKLIKDKMDLKNALYENENIVICEYLPGEEFTIDCFTNAKGKIEAIKMRNRKRIKAGISVNSEILTLEDEVLEIANKINGQLCFKGAWFFQVKKDHNSNYKLLEIAPRISGTMGLSRNTGINYPLLTIFDRLSNEIFITENSYDIEVDRAFISRYQIDYDYEVIYLDLDDTLIMDGEINAFLMMYLYQALNHQKKVILLSKHIHDIKETFKKYKLPQDLFSEIIIIKKEDEKFKYITNEKSIFIDDSFSERRMVSINKNIPVFDCSEVEALIDWRR